MAAKGQCIICRHENAVAIDRDLYNGVSFRKIVAAHCPDVASGPVAIMRHAEHLEVDIKVALEQKKMQRVVDVYEEFAEILDFAINLRDACRELLSDPDDPLRMSLVPRAEEVTVIYLDHTDLNDKGNPTRKNAQLNILLQHINRSLDYEPAGYKIAHVDLRKYALETISTCEMVIDKFARIQGSYKAPTNNDDPAQLAEKMINFLVQRGIARERAIELAKARHPTAPLQLNP